MNASTRCPWPGSDERMIAYHDTEWGVPVHDDRRHFEYLVLDAFQAGLSWQVILCKRDAFRAAFDGFDPARVAAYCDDDVARLLADAGFVRNRQKILATIRNAGAFLRIREEFGSFDAFIWRFVDGAPIGNGWRSPGEVPISKTSWPSCRAIPRVRSSRCGRRRAPGSRCTGSTR